jgi:hypothetical protein
MDRKFSQGKSMIRTGILAALLFAGLTGHATAQYCAEYNDGSQSCGIPTFQACLQTVSGVGGNCTPDNTSQLRPNLMQRWFDRPQNGTPPAIRNPDPMPLPPDLN